MLDLHPDPGWLSSQMEERNSAFLTKAVGKHCILELYECDSLKLNDEVFLMEAVRAAAKVACAKILQLITHEFQPHGVTALALLSESHLSIHTWPESRYAAVDVFTCGDKTKPDLACHVLIKEFCAKHYSLKSLTREVPKMFDNRGRNLETVS